MGGCSVPVHHEPTRQVVWSVYEFGKGVPQDKFAWLGFEPSIAGDGKKEAAKGWVEEAQVGRGEPVLELIDRDGGGQVCEMLETYSGVLQFRDFG